MTDKNPPAPFPNGAKVKVATSGFEWGVVTGWGFYPAWGHWFVRVDTGGTDDEGQPNYALHHPWELELMDGSTEVDRMSEHLSQCPCAAVGVPSCICDDDEECGPQCRHHCICDRLRAALAAQATAHEAALAEARRTTFTDELAEAKALLASRDEAWEQGVSDERARIKAAVQALAAKYPKPSALIYETDVLAIIDGEDTA